jgi:hypothetical protein
METRTLPPELLQLRKVIDAIAAELKSNFTRFTGNQSELAHVGEALATARADRELRERRRDELANASPVELHRRGLGADQATEAVDEEQGKVDAARDREQKAEGKQQQLQEQQGDLLAAIKERVRTLAQYGRLYSEAELQASLGEMADESENLARFTEGPDRLFAATTANQLYSDRDFKAKRLDSASEAEVLHLAQEIIAQPIAPLQQHPARLLHPNTSGTTRALLQLLESVSR